MDDGGQFRWHVDALLKMSHWGVVRESLGLTLDGAGAYDLDAGCNVPAYTVDIEGAEEPPEDACELCVQVYNAARTIDVTPESVVTVTAPHDGLAAGMREWTAAATHLVLPSEEPAPPTLLLVRFQSHVVGGAERTVHIVPGRGDCPPVHVALCTSMLRTSDIEFTDDLSDEACDDCVAVALTSGYELNF
jgi:hypothetical protein